MTRRFLRAAAIRYGVDAFVVPEPGAYARYLESPAWLRRQAEFLASRPGCERTACEFAATIVGHRRYDTLGHEAPADVEALCQRCYDELDLGFSRAQLTLWPDVQARAS